VHDGQSTRHEVDAPALDAEEPASGSSETGTPNVSQLQPGGDTNQQSPGEDAPGDSANPAPSDGEAGAIVRGPPPSVESATAVGPFDVDSITQGLRDGPDYGSQTLFFPTDAAPPLAALAVVPGFVSPESSIREWGPFLASHGFVTLTIGTNTGGEQDVSAGVDNQFFI